MQRPQKAILEIEDIQAIKPNLNEVKVLSRDICLAAECIVFDKEENVLYIITTNNKPDDLNNILEKIKAKWLSTEVYYTSKEWFDEAMKWYDQYEEQEKQKAVAAEQERVASGNYAIWTIKQIFEKRDTMDTGDFIMDIVRLSFQTWASDLHFQSQEDGIIMRLRIDWVLQEVEKFTHNDFKKYLQKIKFIGKSLNSTVGKINQLIIY